MWLQKEGLSVFDYLPGEDTPYPFIHLAESQQSDIQNKTCIHGTVNQTIDLWHTQKNRGSLSEMMLTVKRVCRKIQKTKNFNWSVENITQQVLTDTSTNTPLLHGKLYVQFNFD